MNPTRHKFIFVIRNCAVRIHISRNSCTVQNYGEPLTIKHFIRTKFGQLCIYIRNDHLKLLYCDAKADIYLIERLCIQVSR